MNSFFIQNINVSTENIGYQQLGVDTQYNIALDITPAYNDNTDATIQKLFSLPGQTISIIKENQFKWLTMYTDEFKEFLLKQYPEKVLSDRESFDALFGD